MSGSTPTTEPVAPELLTLRELAKLLMVSERTAWQWAHDGTAPPPLRIGKGSCRYGRRAYEEWVAAGCPRVNGGQAGEK
jgi:predicted DNA-binding transcriptional regulator AlpA